MCRPLYSRPIDAIEKARIAFGDFPNQPSLRRILEYRIRRRIRGGCHEIFIKRSTGWGGRGSGNELRRERCCTLSYIHAFSFFEDVLDGGLPENYANHGEEIPGLVWKPREIGILIGVESDLKGMDVAHVDPSFETSCVLVHSRQKAIIGEPFHPRNCISFFLSYYTHTYIYIFK